jgi:hypothetical protein
MILVVAHNVLQGGGVNIVSSFLEYLQKKNLFVIAVLPNIKIYRDIVEQNDKFKIIWFPTNYYRFIYKIIFLFKIKKIIQIYDVKKVYSLGNIAYKINIPQVVLVQNAFSTLTDYRVWNRFSFFDRVYLKLMQKSILRNLKYASHILVQTETEKKKLSQYISKLSSISIVPNFLDTSKLGKLSSNNIFFDGSSLKLVFLSKYYPHKNFEILNNVCQIIIENNLPITITLTLDGINSNDKKILDLLKKYKSVIENIGHVNYIDLASVYSNHHGIILPTLLESFSGNYIEALYFEKLIFTSDRDFAKEVCGDCAFYFDPFSAASILNELEKVLKYNYLSSKKIANYKDQLKKLNVLNSNNNNELIFLSI